MHMLILHTIFDQTSRCTDQNPQKVVGMKKVIKRLYKDESGASSTEYAILVCCIAVAIIFTVLMFGQVVNGLYTNANAKFPVGTLRGMAQVQAKHLLISA